MAERTWPVVVVGGGAAGLIAALFAAEGRSRVLLLERTAMIGKKILISGGGRCNVLPAEAHTGVFETAAERAILDAVLAAWPLAEQTRFFERDLGVRLKREAFDTTVAPLYPGVRLSSRFDAPGKLFPVSDRAADVRDALLAACHRRGVEVRLNASLAGLAWEAGRGAWRLELGGWAGGKGTRDDAGARLSPPLFARRVILATGGLSVPTTGSDGTGLKLAQALGLAATPTYPALTPLLGGNAAHHDLAGVALPVAITAGSPALRVCGPFLFTHRGYSGPAVLDVSHVAARGRGEKRPEIRVAWSETTAEAWAAALVSAPGSVLAVLRDRLPERLARALLAEAGLPEARRAAELPRPDRRRLIDLLTRYALPWTGDEGYRKAEVTGGGVRLDAVDGATLESRAQMGLYLCGEMLDVFGPIGGYNFLWAWASGRVAGRAAGG
ncbi:MAG: aminoacetone oxidase family FAD-binding enzyme [Anaerolineae bacterium]